MRDREPAVDVTEDKLTEITPQAATGFVHVYPDNAIFWLESRTNDYGVVMAIVSMNGLEQGGNTTSAFKMKLKAFPPSMTMAYVTWKVRIVVIGN